MERPPGGAQVSPAVQDGGPVFQFVDHSGKVMVYHSARIDDLLLEQTPFSATGLYSLLFLNI
jgi:hypothetical protein